MDNGRFWDRVWAEIDGLRAEVKTLHQTHSSLREEMRLLSAKVAAIIGFAMWAIKEFVSFLKDRI